MQGSPSKNIQNIAVQLNLAERKKNINFKSDSKPKMEIKSSPLTKMKLQRNLSPWNRKKDYPTGKTASIQDEPNLQVVNLVQRQIDVKSRKQSIVLTEEKMSDFLQKIHFTNKKKSVSQGISLQYNPNKLQQNHIMGKKQSLKKYPSHNLTDLTQEEIRKIIIYPKNTQKNDINGKMKSNLKDKNKHNSVNKMASIQNFYDPYQNKTKISKKLLKYRLKLNDQLSQHAVTTRVNDSTVSQQDFQTTWRKNSIPQKVHRRNFSMPEDEMHQSRKVRVRNQNQTRGTFFKTRTTNFQRNFKTQPTQRDNQTKQDPQKNQIQHEQEKQRTLSSFEPSYATPSGQAIKRIKHQYKKSRRIKTTQNNFRTQHSKLEIQHSTRQNNFYLYQTFLNYKSNKDSSGMNITKTLGFNFHNQQTFKQNIQKVWLKSKH